MDRRAIPDHQQLAGDVAQQVLQEADDVGRSRRSSSVMPLMTERWSRVNGTRRIGVWPRGASVRTTAGSS